MLKRKLKYKDFIKSKRWFDIKNTYRKDKNAWKCWVCGYRRNLQLHHLEYSKPLDDPTNLVVLCRNHHQTLHFWDSGKNRFNPHRRLEHVKELKGVINKSKKKLSIRKMHKMNIKITPDDWGKLNKTPKKQYRKPADYVFNSRDKDRQDDVFLDVLKNI